MSTYLTVRAFGQVASQHRATLASLPAILRLTETGTPDIALTAADVPSIMEALSLSPKAIVIADPAAVDPVGALQLAATSTPIIPALTLAASLRQIGVEGAPFKAALIHSRLSLQEDIKTALLEHLVGLASVVDGLTDLKLLSRIAGGYVGSARTAAGVDIAWSGLAGARSAHYELDIVGLAGRLEVRAELDGSAQPLLVRRGHQGGLDQPLGVYETGLRLFWREVAGTIARDQRMTKWQDIAAIREFIAKFASEAPAPNSEVA